MPRKNPDAYKAYQKAYYERTKEIRGIGERVYKTEEEKKQTKKDWYEKKKTDPQWLENERLRRCEVTKKHYYTHRDQKLTYAKEYRDRNPEKVSLARKTARLNNIEEARRRSLAWHRQNPEASQANDRAWREKNKELLRRRRRDRIATDAHFAIRRRIDARLRQALRYSHIKTKSSIVDLLGCNIQEFMCYIEGQFQSGMSWDNRKLWHLDHKRPIASFYLTEPDQQLLAFNYKNLQPLWAKDNLKKSAKWPYGEDSTELIK